MPVIVHSELFGTQYDKRRDVVTQIRKDMVLGNGVHLSFEDGMGSEASSFSPQGWI